MRHLIVPGLLLIGACGPIPVDQAMKQCIEPAQLAQHPRGSVGIVADNHGHIGTSISIGISTNYLNGDDPNTVYNNCVVQRSGQMPLLPFSSLPESRL